MPTIEERVATLEGRMTPDIREEMSRGFSSMREDMGRLRGEFGQLRADFGQLRDEFGQLRADFGQLRDEFGQLRGELGHLRDEMTRRFERVDGRMDRQFTWLVGIQLTTMITVIGALATVLLR